MTIIYTILLVLRNKNNIWLYINFGGKSIMKVAVIDAQGAGLGQAVIKKIRREIGEKVHIIALGTNNIATSNMIKAGASEGFSGEKQICSFLSKNIIDSIVGPIGIISSGGIQGEITPLISEAIFNTDCTKYIIPLKLHGLYIPGTRSLEIKEIIEEIVCDIEKHIK